MSHATRCLPAKGHALLAYARAGNAMAARKAIQDAQAHRLVDKADLAFSAAAAALEGKLLDSLPPGDLFTRHVRALVAVAEAATGVPEATLNNFSAWPEALRKAYEGLARTQEERVDMARMLVTRAEPGYKHYVAALSLQADERIPTACVNHDFLVRYNPGFFAHLSFGQLMFVLLHETEHVTHRHIPRSFPLLPSLREMNPGAHAALTNIGADLEILARQLRAAREATPSAADPEGSFAKKFSANVPGTLSSEHVDDSFHYRFPEAWLICEDLKIPAGTRINLTDSFFEKITGELFETLSPTTEDEKGRWRETHAGLDGAGEFEAAPDADAASTHSAREAALRSATKVELEKRNRAGRNARGMGVGEDEAIVVPQRPTPLSHFISQLAGLSHALRGTHPSWAKPDRYSHVTGVFSPARIRVKEPILFAFDTSGSVSDDELAFAINCIRNYQLTNIFSEVHLCLWHTDVYFWHNLSAPLDIRATAIQRGGTLMSSVAAYLKDHPGLARPTLAVFVTDGYVEPDPAFPSVRNIVLCTRRENVEHFAKSPSHALWADVRA